MGPGMDPLGAVLVEDEMAEGTAKYCDDMPGTWSRDSVDNKMLQYIAYVKSPALGGDAGSEEVKKAGRVWLKSEHNTYGSKSAKTVAWKIYQERKAARTATRAGGPGATEAAATEAGSTVGNAVVLFDSSDESS